MKRALGLCTLLFALGPLAGHCQSAPVDRAREVSDAITAGLLLLHESPEETLAPTRWDTGGTTISNEARLDLFRPAMEQANGGVYIGVGSVQNLTLAAWARSEFVYLMDFTRIVVANNQIHVALIKEAPTIEEYLALWSPARNADARAILERAYGQRPDFPFILNTLIQARPFFNAHVQAMTGVSRQYPVQLYFQDPELYARVRALALGDRIRPIKGNLLGDTTLIGIGNAVRQAGAVVRVLYLSNAEEYNDFRPYPAQFQANVRGLPVDQLSVVLRTMSIFEWTHPWAPGSELLMDKGFHYGAQPLGAFQNALAGPPTYVYELFRDCGQTDGVTGYTWIRACAAPVAENHSNP